MSPLKTVSKNNEKGNDDEEEEEEDEEGIQNDQQIRTE